MASCPSVAWRIHRPSCEAFGLGEARHPHVEAVRRKEPSSVPALRCRAPRDGHRASPATSRGRAPSSRIGRAFSSRTTRPTTIASAPSWRARGAGPPRCRAAAWRTRRPRRPPSALRHPRFDGIHRAGGPLPRRRRCRRTPALRRKTPARRRPRAAPCRRQLHGDAVALERRECVGACSTWSTRTTAVRSSIGISVIVAAPRCSTVPTKLKGACRRSRGDLLVRHRMVSSCAGRWAADSRHRPSKCGRAPSFTRRAARLSLPLDPCQGQSTAAAAVEQPQLSSAGARPLARDLK